MSTVINLKFYDHKWYVIMMDKHNKAPSVKPKRKIGRSCTMKVCIMYYCLVIIPRDQALLHRLNVDVPCTKA